MSLIITYISSKGCVVAGDKRRIGFFGPEADRETLEEGLYTGKIKSTDELLSKAQDLDITLKISDDADKIRIIGDVAVGEVRSKTTTETRRKRIYATTGAYNMVELLGSEIKKITGGGSSIVVFGNKYTKELAEKLLKKHWNNKINLMAVGKIFESVMEEVANETPSVSREYDVIIKYPVINYKNAKELLRTTIITDVKELERWRNELRDDMLKTSQNIQMATRIVIGGNIGVVTSVKDSEIGIKLDEGIEALDTNWKPLAKSGEIIIMKVENSSNVSNGDVAVIEDENLCIKRTKESLTCDFILCKSE